MAYPKGDNSFQCKVQAAAVCSMQGAELPVEAVSGLPGGAGDPAGVGERGATSADLQPGNQLLLRPVSLHGQHTPYFDVRSHRFMPTLCVDGGGYPCPVAVFVLNLIV